jgi:hypothetical protein
MSEAAGRQEMERKLVRRSLEDEPFRKVLLFDPKAAGRPSGPPPEKLPARPCGPASQP